MKEINWNIHNEREKEILRILLRYKDERNISHIRDIVGGRYTTMQRLIKMYDIDLTAKGKWNRDDNAKAIAKDVMRDVQNDMELRQKRREQHKCRLQSLKSKISNASKVKIVAHPYKIMPSLGWSEWDDAMYNFYKELYLYKC